MPFLDLGRRDGAEERATPEEVPRHPSGLRAKGTRASVLPRRQVETEPLRGSCHAGGDKILETRRGNPPSRAPSCCQSAPSQPPDQVLAICCGTALVAALPGDLVAAVRHSTRRCEGALYAPPGMAPRSRGGRVQSRRSCGPGGRRWHRQRHGAGEMTEVAGVTTISTDPEDVSKAVRKPVSAASSLRITTMSPDLGTRKRARPGVARPAKVPRACRQRGVINPEVVV